jgi:hypothetical protein
MKTTHRLDGLGQNRWLDGITREVRSSRRDGIYIDDLAMTFPAAATQIGWQEE